MRRPLVALTLAILAGLLPGCAAGPQALDATAATAVLAAQMALVQPMFHFVNGMDENDDPAEVETLRTLEGNGILASYIAPSLFSAVPEKHYRLAARGRALAAGWRKETLDAYEIHIGTFRLVRVTAVEMLEPRHAMVSFDYTIDLNAMGRLLRDRARPEVNFYDPLQFRVREIRAAVEPASDLVEVSLFDDGWKSESWRR